MLDKEVATEQSAKEALLRQVQNKYQQLPTGSEAFASRKQEEIDTEDRRTIAVIR